MDYLALRKDLQSSDLSSNLKDAPPPSPSPRSSTLPASSSSASASRNYSSSYEATATSSTLTQSRDYGSLGGGGRRGDSFDVFPPK